MSSAAGSPYARFRRRALKTGNLAIVKAAAAELPTIALDDALEICLVMADAGSEHYERAALRWLARFSTERANTVADVAEAADALDLLRHDRQAVADLRRLSR